MDSGNLVSDQLIIEMVTNYIADIPSILLDGFPRTLEQARAFENKLSNIEVIGNGESIYYVEDEINSEVIGVNKIICSNMNIIINN